MLARKLASMPSRNAALVLATLHRGGFVLLIVPVFDHARPHVNGLMDAMRDLAMSPRWSEVRGRLESSSGSILQVVSEYRAAENPMLLRGYHPEVLWAPYGMSRDIEREARGLVRPLTGVVLTGFDLADLSDTHTPPQENPSAGASDQGSVVPPAGSCSSS